MRHLLLASRNGGPGRLQMLSILALNVAHAVRTKGPSLHARLGAVAARAGLAVGDGLIKSLRENNCEEVQGYHLSRPIPASDFEAFVRGWVQRGEDAAPDSQSATRKRRKFGRDGVSPRRRRAVSR